MQLMDERLRPFAVTREQVAVAGASGLSTRAAPLVFQVELDLQTASTPRFTREEGVVRITGGFRAFTYDDRLVAGDRLLDTPHGALRVESVEAWVDEEPVHYELGLVPA
jgi:hypothetical protein